MQRDEEGGIKGEEARVRVHRPGDGGPRRRPDRAIHQIRAGRADRRVLLRRPVRAPLGARRGDARYGRGRGRSGVILLGLG